MKRGWGTDPIFTQISQFYAELGRRRKIALNKNKLKEMRLKKGLTQYALAKKVNKSHWWVSRVERGLTEVSGEEKVKEIVEEAIAALKPAVLEEVEE